MMHGMTDTTEEDQVEARVYNIPKCQFVHMHMHETDEGMPDAAYDFKTTLGAWAFGCESCFKLYGLGVGTGKGQRLVKVEK